MKHYRGILFFLIIGLTSSCLAQGYDYLVRDAEGKMEAGQYREALNLYEKAFRSGEFHFLDYYYSAQGYALLANHDAAFDYLNKAVIAGFMNEDRLTKNPDFEKLRQDRRWKAVIAGIRQNITDMTTAFPETHEGLETIELPTPKFEGQISVEAALKNRRSLRSYTGAELDLFDISQLLWAAFGITKTYENTPSFMRGGVRTTPSAGALYPLDLYIVAWNVTDLPAGIYKYRSEDHSLLKLKEGDHKEKLSEAAFYQSHFKTSSACIVYSAVFERNMRKYGQRGRERYVCMDLGFSAENVYLQGYTLSIGTCAIGAYVDLWVKKLVGMTRDEEPLLLMPLGRME